MGIVITEIQEYCPELKMEQQRGAHWCFLDSSDCLFSHFLLNWSCENFLSYGKICLNLESAVHQSC